MLCIAVLTFSCVQREQCSFYLFSFPPESAPHENNWEYIGSIYVYYEERISIPSNKRHWIEITDRNDKKYLDDEFYIYGGQIWEIDEWNVFDSLLIIFYDVKDGEPYKALDSLGDSVYTNYLTQVTYVFDSISMQFERISGP